MAELQKTLDKLRKLIAHEESARKIGSLAEAQAYAVKIQRLCNEYRITQSQLSEEELRATVVKVEWHWKSVGFDKDWRKSERWFNSLAASCAHAHEARCIRYYAHGSHLGFDFIGLESDANTAAAMFGVLYRAALAAWLKLKPSERLTMRRERFLLGFAVAISERYRKQSAVAHTQASSDSQALIRTVHLLINEHFEDVKQARQSRAVTADSSVRQGYQAGQNVSLSAQTLPSALLALTA